MNCKNTVSLLLAALLLCLQLVGCTQAKPPADTDSESAFHTHTEAPTEEPTGSAPSDTDPETDADTDATTDEVTDEATTEAEAELPLPEKGLTIGGADISDFTVVRSADMPEGQITVLNFFVEQLREVFGVTLPVITDDQSAEREIVIGSTNRQSDGVRQAVSEILDDGYAIVVDGGNLYIAATTGRGVVYGVGDFLEKYVGARLYSVEFIAHRAIGAVTLEEGHKDVFSPAFEARRTWIDGLYSDNLDKIFYLKNNSDGLKKAKVGDTVVIRTNSNHTIDNLAGVDNEAAVPCLTDEEVYKTVLAAVVKKIDKNPDQNAIQVGQGDGGRPCKCERCEAIHKEYGTENATWFLFINRLADEVASLYPDLGIKIITYSYQYTHGVPGNGYTVSDNVIINFCFDKACYNHAFDDPTCPKNAPVVAEFKQWAAMCKADNLFVYEYAYNCGDNYLPDPNLLVMWDNFKLYADCGVNGILSEGITAKGGEFDYLRAYLRSHLVWNPYMTEEEYYTLMDEFMEDWYGDAAPILREYMNILFDGERITCTDMYTPMYTFFQTDAEEGGTSVNQEIMNQCQALFDAAFALETLTEEQRDHLEYTALHFMIVRYTYFSQGSRTEKKALLDKITELRARYGI